MTTIPAISSRRFPDRRRSPSPTPSRGAVTQDDLGKALTLDTTAPNTMKLAGDGDPVHGRLETYEDRSQQGAGKVGTVQRQFKERSRPPGTRHRSRRQRRRSGAGLIKDAGAATPNRTLCVEAGADFVVIEAPVRKAPTQ
jgi:hypothetical protein